MADFDPEAFLQLEPAQATTFASPSDLENYRRTKSLATGDNGVGAWGDDTTTDEPMVAIPPDHATKRFGSPDAAYNQLVEVHGPDGRSVVARIADKMPNSRNISNGANLDMNPGTYKALGLDPNTNAPVFVRYLNKTKDAQPFDPASFVGSTSQRPEDFYYDDSGKKVPFNSQTGLDEEKPAAAAKFDPKAFIADDQEGPRHESPQESGIYAPSIIPQGPLAPDTTPQNTQFGGYLDDSGNFVPTISNLPSGQELTQRTGRGLDQLFGGTAVGIPGLQGSVLRALSSPTNESLSAAQIRAQRDQLSAALREANEEAARAPYSLPDQNKALQAKQALADFGQTPQGPEGQYNPLNILGGAGDASRQLATSMAKRLNELTGQYTIDPRRDQDAIVKLLEGGINTGSLAGGPLAMAQQAYGQTFAEALKGGASEVDARKMAEGSAVKVAPMLAVYKGTGALANLLPVRTAAGAIEKGVTQGAYNAAGNVAGSSLLRKMEGGDAGDLQSSLPFDLAFALKHGIDTTKGVRAQEQGNRFPIPPDEASKLDQVQTPEPVQREDTTTPPQTQTVPEKPETLVAQMEQLKAGQRPAVMFPGVDAKFDLPPGMRRVKTDSGTFVFNPELTSAAEIRELDASGRQNEILNLGRQSKAEAIATSPNQEPGIVKETDPNGLEIRAAVASPDMAQKTAAEMEGQKTPGSLISFDSPENVLAKRAAGEQVAPNERADVTGQPGGETPAAEGLRPGVPEVGSRGEGPGQLPAGGLPEGDQRRASRISSRLNDESGHITIPSRSEIADFGKRIYQKGMDFARWSAEMVRHLGEKVRIYLTDSWNRIRGSHGEVGAVGDLDGFHVSTELFDKFSDEKLGTGLGHHNFTEGHYFTGDEEAARQMREQVEERTGKPAHLTKNRLNVDPDHLLDYNKSAAEQTPFVKEALKKFGLNADAVNAGRVSMADWIARQGNPRRLKIALMKAGIEGTLYDEPLRRGRNVVVYDPAKIEQTHVNDQPISPREKKFETRMSGEEGGVNPKGGENPLEKAKARQERMKAGIEEAHASPDRPEGRELKGPTIPRARDEKTGAILPPKEPENVKPPPFTRAGNAIGGKLAELGNKIAPGIVAHIQNAPSRAQAAVIRDRQDTRPNIRQEQAFTAVRLADKTTTPAEDQAIHVIKDSGLNREEIGRQLQQLQEAAADTKSGKIRKNIDKYMPIFRRAYEYFDRLSQSGQIAEHDAQVQESLAEEKRYNAAPNEIENYASRLSEGNVMGDRSGDVPLLFSGAGGKDRYYMNARQYPDLASMIIGGEKPVLGLAKAAAARVGAGQRVISEMRSIDAFKQLPVPWDQGKPVITDQYEERVNHDGTTTRVMPEGYVKMRIGDNEVMVHKQFQGVMKALFGEKWLGTGPVGAAFMKYAAFAKHGTLILDTYHAMRVMYKQWSYGGGNPVHWDRLINGDWKSPLNYRQGLSLVEYRAQDLSKAVEAGEITQREADYAKAMRPMFNELIEQGLNMGRNTENLWKELNHGWIDKASFGQLGKFNRWLFEKLQRGATAQVAVAAYEKNLKMYGGEMSRADIARKTAWETNRIFSNLGRQGIFKSQTGQALARIIFLAPQWAEGQLRTNVSQYGQAAKVGTDVLQGRFRAGVLARGMGRGILTMLAINQVLNYAINGKSTFENDDPEHKLDAHIPVKGTRGFFFNPLEIADETSHNIMRALSYKRNALDAALQVLGNKLSPLARGANTLATGKDFAGRPFVTDDTSDGKKRVDVGARLKAAAIDALPSPMPLQSVLEKNPQSTFGYRANQEPGSVVKQVASSFGAKLQRAPSPEAKLWADAAPYRDDNVTAFPRSKFSDLKRALDRGIISGDSSEAVQRISELKAQGIDDKAIQKSLGITFQGGKMTVKDPTYAKSSQDNQAFINSLDAYQQKLLKESIAENYKKAQLYRQIK